MAIDSGPPRAWVPITTHATNPIASGCRAIRVGDTAGTIVAKMDGYPDDITLQVAAHQIVPGRFTHVRDTSTAATLHAGI